MLSKQPDIFPFRILLLFSCISLPEEEIVKGFNMISPYQKILPKTFNERKSSKESARLRFFPFNITNGKTYSISIWAKTEAGNIIES